MFRPGREARWEYAGETIEHIEEHNCSLGCRRSGTRKERAEFGPGGTCDVLARVFLGEPIAELDDDGKVVTCTVREPLPERTPRRRSARREPAGQLTIGEA